MSKKVIYWIVGIFITLFILSGIGALNLYLHDHKYFLGA